MFIEDIKRLTLPGGPQLNTIGWIPAHSVDIKMAPFNINFCIQSCLDPKSNTYFMANGISRKASFPQVQVWMPGHHYEYKYDGIIESFYFGYNKKYLSWAEKLLHCIGYDISVEFFKIDLTAAISGLMHDMKNLMNDIHHPGNIDRLDILANLLMVEIFTNVQQKPKEHSEGPCYDYKVREIAACINRDYLNFDLNNELKRHSMEKRTFYRHWGEIFSVSPHQYLHKCRLHQAELLLEHTKLTVKEIADKTGFSDSFHFSKSFKKNFGISPSMFRLQRVNYVGSSAFCAKS